MRNFLVFGGLCAAAGLLLGLKLAPKPKTEIKEVVKERVVTQTRTVTKPDGTIVQVIREAKDVQKEATKTEAVSQAMYAISATKYTDGDYGIGAGIRLGNLPAFLEGTYKQNGLIGVGLRLEF